MTYDFNNKNTKKLKQISNNKKLIITNLRKKGSSLRKRKKSNSNEERFFSLKPKVSNIFTYFFNITDLKKVNFYFCFEHRKSSLDKNIFYVNKFNFKKKNNYVELKKKSIDEEFLDLSNIVSINHLLEENNLQIKTLDNEIYNTIVAYKEEDKEEITSKRDIRLKSNIEVITNRIENIEKIKSFGNDILENIKDYKSRVYFIKMLCYLEYQEKSENLFNIKLSDALNLLETSTDEFKTNIISSNIELNDSDYNKEDHYYYLHLFDYDISLKNQYFIDYVNLFSINISKDLARILYFENNDSITDLLNLKSDECILPIFNKEFNPAFNKIPSILEYKFRVSEEGFNSLYLNFNLYDNGSTRFVDEDETYELTSELYDNQINFTRKYINLNDDINQEYIYLSFENINDEIASILQRNFESSISIYEFDKAFKINSEYYEFEPENKDIKVKNILSEEREEALVVKTKKDIKFEIYIPVFRLLDVFWSSLYEINKK
jgi:hypothetical protein